MNVLWITTANLNAVNKKKSASAYNSTGWVQSLLNIIAHLKGNNVYVASPYDVKEIERFEEEGINYILIPSHGHKKESYQSRLEPIWKKIKKEINPNVVHIHGTEFPFALSYINACGADNVVVSLQGILSGIVRYEWAGITLAERIRNYTVGDLLRSIKHIGSKGLAQRVKYEIEYLQKVHHVIGRTEWDKSHVLSINPEITYHHCEEILRPTFYKSNKWSYDNCIPQSIFVTNAHTPLKGFHVLLKALVPLKKKYPKLMVRISASSYMESKWYKKTTYQRYLMRKTEEYGLEENLEFLGGLNEERMTEEYLRANVFVSCSSIENSSNALKEAQTLGTPFVASYVGGTPSQVPLTQHQWLYGWDEWEVLASKIDNIFLQKDNIKFEPLVDDREQTGATIMQIYNEVSNE